MADCNVCIHFGVVRYAGTLTSALDLWLVTVVHLAEERVFVVCISFTAACCDNLHIGRAHVLNGRGLHVDFGVLLHAVVGIGRHCEDTKGDKMQFQFKSWHLQAITLQKRIGLRV